MKQAIIDIGSNSMRLTVYETEGAEFKILFREKIMAGLAGYVEGGKLSAEGIDCACAGLGEFRDILTSLSITNCAVFATASLRNIRNTDAALAAIKAATGFDVEVISGEEEALCGYAGAMREIEVASGAFVDIGGASTEVVSFEHRKVLGKASFGVGSLKLYKDCVKKILPGDGSMKRIQRSINEAISENRLFPFEKRSPLICVGGSSRAVLVLAKKYYNLPAETRSLTPEQLYGLCDFLCGGSDEAAELILRHEPDRIHTIVPGIMVLRHICRLFEPEEIIVCKYGVREGYLCRKILTRGENDTSIPKTGS